MKTIYWLGIIAIIAQTIILGIAIHHSDGNLLKQISFIAALVCLLVLVVTINQ